MKFILFVVTYEKPPQSSFIISAAFSAIMYTGALGCPATIAGTEKLLSFYFFIFKYDPIQKTNSIRILTYTSVNDS